MNKIKPTVRKIAANRENAQKSTGPTNPTSTRYNALKHGLLSRGITELDQPQEFQRLLEELKKELAPTGVLEEECINQIAILTVRIRRARLFEAEAFTAHLNPPETVSHPGEFGFDERALGWTEETDPGLPAQVSLEAIDQVNRTILRYESANENKLFRWLHHVERLQRLRRGEHVSAPAIMDLNVHHETRADLASFGNAPE